MTSPLGKGLFRWAIGQSGAVSEGAHGSIRVRAEAQATLCCHEHKGSKVARKVGPGVKVLVDTKWLSD